MTTSQTIRSQVQGYRSLLSQHIHEIQKAPKAHRKPIADAIAACRRFLAKENGDAVALKDAIRQGTLTIGEIQADWKELLENKSFQRTLAIVERRRQLLLKLAK